MSHSTIPLDPTKEYAPWVYKHGLQFPYGECQCGCGESPQIAEQTTPRELIIKGEPKRFIRWHHTRVTPIRSLEDRFWEKVEKRGFDECWEWQASTIRFGYGKFWDGKNKYTNAHRVAYELTYGPIPDGLLVMHTCDNPPCCNPNHLQIGTHKDNGRDMVRKGRASRIKAKGERQGSSKLTDGKVMQIRLLYDTGDYSHRQLARIFNISRRTIGRVIKRDGWKHVE